MLIPIIFFTLLILLVVYLIVVFNRFKTLENAAEATLGQVRVALKKRLELLHQLLESIRSYASFEKDTLERITEMRSSILKAKSPEDISKVEVETKHILGNLLVTVERYPTLKTSNLVKDLLNSIQNVEDEIARLRYTYNNIIQEYNTNLEIFPSNLVGKLFNFKKKEYLSFEEVIRERPNLNWKI